MLAVVLQLGMRAAPGVELLLLRLLILLKLLIFDAFLLAKLKRLLVLTSLLRQLLQLLLQAGEL